MRDIIIRVAKKPIQYVELIWQRCYIHHDTMRSEHFASKNHECKQLSYCWTLALPRDIGPVAVSFCGEEKKILKNIEYFSGNFVLEKIKPADIRGFSCSAEHDITLYMDGQDILCNQMYFYDFSYYDIYGYRREIKDMVVWWRKEEWSSGRQHPFDWIIQHTPEKPIELFGITNWLDDSEQDQVAYVADVFTGI